MKLLKVTVLLFVLAHCAFAGTDTVAVRGALTCGGQWEERAVYVSIWDHDKTSADDLVNISRSQRSDGRFEINGTNVDMLGFDPYLKIYHRCTQRDYYDGCYVTKTIKIPDVGVSSGTVADNVIDLGRIELEYESDDGFVECNADLPPGIEIPKGPTRKV